MIATQLHCSVLANHALPENIFGSVLIPFADTIWPKYSTSFLNNWHFLGLSLSHASCSLHNTLSRLDALPQMILHGQ